MVYRDGANQAGVVGDPRHAAVEAHGFGGWELRY
jgi:hypothetical protein